MLPALFAAVLSLSKLERHRSLRSSRFAISLAFRNAPEAARTNTIGHEEIVAELRALYRKALPERSGVEEPLVVEVPGAPGEE